MKGSLILLLVAVVMLSSCKKNAASIPIHGAIKIDVGANNAKFKFSKFTTPVDSLKLSFESKEIFNCNLYRFNANTNTSGNTIEVKLYNIYYTNGFCIYGNYPATFDYAITPLKKSKYNLIVQKADRTYTGEITVTDTKYFISWQHDDILAIEQKEFVL